MVAPAAIAGMVTALAGVQQANASMLTAVNDTVRMINEFDEKNRERDVNMQKRDNRVHAFTTDFYFKLKDFHVNSIALIRAGLDCDIRGRYEYVAIHEILGWQYEIYGIREGTVTNNDKEGRGYHNWCVRGKNIQQDNVMAHVQGKCMALVY